MAMEILCKSVIVAKYGEQSLWYIGIVQTPHGLYGSICAACDQAPAFRTSIKIKVSHGRNTRFCLERTYTTYDFI